MPVIDAWKQPIYQTRCMGLGHPVCFLPALSVLQWLRILDKHLHSFIPNAYCMPGSASGTGNRRTKQSPCPKEFATRVAKPNKQKTNQTENPNQPARGAKLPLAATVRGCGIVNRQPWRTPGAVICLKAGALWPTFLPG